MFRGGFASSGPGQLDKNEVTMNSALYQETLKKNHLPSGCDLKLTCCCIIRQGNDSTHRVTVYSNLNGSKYVP